MAIDVERFFELFLEELRVNTSFSSYYKYHEDSKSFAFRKAYFVQRLKYIHDVLRDAEKQETILDIGCGYATTALFLVVILALRGLSGGDHVDGKEDEA